MAVVRMKRGGQCVEKRSSDKSKELLRRHKC